MAKLGFNSHGWDFEQGVKSLLRSFRLAASAMDRQIDAALDAIRDYRQHIESGGKVIGEWDEDGFRVWTQDQVLEFDLTSAEEAAMALRKAYALQLYHFWERSAHAWTLSKPNTSHTELVEKTIAAGYPVNDRLNAVKHLANTLKHGNPKHGKMLYETWNAVVALPPPSNPSMVGDWYSVIKLTDADLRDIGRIVATSGPPFKIDDVLL